MGGLRAMDFLGAPCKQLKTNELESDRLRHFACTHACCKTLVRLQGVNQVKRIVVVLSLMLVMGSLVWAEEAKNEVTIQGSGFFTKKSTGKGVEDKPTYSGGFLAGYRYNLNHRFALEADYDYFRNSQKYPNSGTYIKTNVSAVTARQ